MFGCNPACEYPLPLVGRDGSSFDERTRIHHVQETYPSLPESVGRSRDLLKAFEGTVEVHTLFDVRLVISELVTNVVRHAEAAEDSWIGVDVAVSQGLIRGEVSDAGAGFSLPLLPELPPPGQVAGRGLYMISRTVDRWGVTRQEFFCVWFEIDR